MRRSPISLSEYASRAGIVLIALTAALLMGRQRNAQAAAQLAPVTLLQGWNNFAYLGPAEPVTAALAPIAGKYDALWQYDAANQVWRSFNPNAPDKSDFTDMDQGSAYWIHMLQAATLPIGQPGIAYSSGPLATGWNNLVQAAAGGAVTTVMAAYGVQYSAVWHWNAALQRWELFDPNALQVSDFQTLVQGQAYFVQVTGGGAALPQSCFPFTSYQPQLNEVADALTRAGNNT